MSATENPQPLRAEDLPPAPPPRKRRGMGTLRSMVISMLVLVAILFAFVAMVPRPEKVDRLPVDSVVALKNARQLGKAQFSGLEPVPAGWSANNATYSPGDTGVATWNVGFVHGDAFNGLKQTTGANDDWYAATMRDFTRDGQQTLDGATWERWIDRDSFEHRLLRRAKAGAMTTVLSSSSSYDDAAAFGARLTPKP